MVTGSVPHTPTQFFCKYPPGIVGRTRRSLKRLRFTCTPNGRREFVPRDQVFPYFPFTLHCFYIKISSFILVSTIGIVRDYFHLLIFYSEKFLTWVWRLPLAVNVNLNLSIVPGVLAETVKTGGAFHLSELTGQTIPNAMRISILLKSLQPYQSNPK